MFRIGVDIGGTFTDVTVLNALTGEMTIAKVPSRRTDASGALVDAVEEGLRAAKADAEKVSLLVHGTTIVTNAVLENKLPKSALVTTAGFRDVLEIGRHFRPDMYDLQQDRAAPVVRREHRYCVEERMAADGSVLRRPDRASVLALSAELRREDVKAVSICFLNAYVNPANEELVREWLAEELGDLPISASYEVCREMREFERMSTVCLNAAAVPLVKDYLSLISTRIAAVLPNAKILLMQSNGGSLTVDAAKAHAARLITSGPAGGALAIQRMGKATQIQNLLGVDMGGTSTDISLIERGELRMTTEASIAGRPVKLPMIEINTIGAGSGSIAWLDEANGLHVGPQSAGSEPGPAAYGMGGIEPTVMDANLVLGRFAPERFAGGRIRLDVAAAAEAITRRIAGPLNLSVEEAALGIIRIANSNMERAVRVSSAQKGYDPRSIALVAFGGAGPMHAAALARSAGIPSVLVPEYPGVLSAVGLVTADIRHDFVRTRVLRGAEITVDTVSPIFETLAALGTVALERDGVAANRHQLRRTADLRYVGQAYEINVPLPEGPVSAETLAATIQAFHAEHLRLYSHNHPLKPLEFVSARLTAVGLMGAPEIRAGGGPLGLRSPRLAMRPVYFEEAGGYVDTPVFQRAELGRGDPVAGPLIIEQPDTTTVVHPGQCVTVDEFGNIVIKLEDAHDAR